MVRFSFTTILQSHPYVKLVILSDQNIMQIYLYTRLKYFLLQSTGCKELPQRPKDLQGLS